MNGYRIVVDAGHGGSDPGAVSGNLKEKDFTLQAANYMYDRFKELGVPVAITRDDDRTLTRQERLSTMTDTFGNDSKVIILSNHINAGGGEGAEIIYPLRSSSTLPSMILDAIGEKGQIKRKYYQRVLPEDPTKDYYYIMRETPDTTALLIEYGFIDNANDRKKLQNNLLDYVEGVVEAVANYIGVEYTEPKPSNNLYTVKKGDTLYSIANRFNTTVQALKSLNNLTSNILTIGQTLKIPTTEENTQTTYTVKSGDTLYSIANRFNTTVQVLKSLNNLTSNILTIGQILKIPTTDNNIPEEGTDEYTVQSGDSLYSIAQKFNTTVNDLIEHNQLATTIIQPGQVLKIPSVTSTNIVYTVKSGDTLYSIANNYGVSVDAIKKLNNLTSNILSIGQRLYIPKGSIVEETDFVVYEVKPGDTLYSIAKKYNTTPETIKNYNNLTSNLLTINQVLQIPVERVLTENIIYTVKKGDSLYQIANNFGVNVAEIMNLNNLTSTLLSVGQTLLIPIRILDY